MALNMGSNLTALRPVGFSETARSPPDHPEARRDVVPGARHALAIPRRRLADDVAEGAAERAQAREADVEADLGDAAVGLGQQRHRALHAAALQVAVRCLAERRAERAD